MATNRIALFFSTLFVTIPLCIGAAAFSVDSPAASPITAEQAQQLALKQTGGGEIAELEKKSPGTTSSYYRLEVIKEGNEYSLEIDASTGELLKYLKKNRHTAQTGLIHAVPQPSVPSPTQALSNPAPLSTTESLTLEQAQAMALQLTGGGTVIESEIDGLKKGRLVYEFEIFNNGIKYEIDIDGKTGDVLKHKAKRKHP